MTKCEKCGSEMKKIEKRFSTTYICESCGNRKGFSVMPIKGMYPWER